MTDKEKGIAKAKDALRRLSNGEPIKKIINKENGEVLKAQEYHAHNLAKTGKFEIVD